MGDEGIATEARRRRLASNNLLTYHFLYFEDRSLPPILLFIVLKLERK